MDIERVKGNTFPLQVGEVDFAKQMYTFALLDQNIFVQFMV